VRVRVPATACAQLLVQLVAAVRQILTTSCSIAPRSLSQSVALSSSRACALPRYAAPRPDLPRAREEVTASGPAGIAFEISAHDAACPAQLVARVQDCRETSCARARERCLGSAGASSEADLVFDRGRNHGCQRIAHQDHPQPIRQCRSQYRELSARRVRDNNAQAASAAARSSRRGKRAGITRRAPPVEMKRLRSNCVAKAVSPISDS